MRHKLRSGGANFPSKNISSSSITNRFLSTHADRQGVDISFTVFVCVCLYGYGFLRRCFCYCYTRSTEASNFARRFTGVQGRESHILGNFAPQKPKIGRIGERAGHLHVVHMACRRVILVSVIFSFYFSFED